MAATKKTATKTAAKTAEDHAEASFATASAFTDAAQQQYENVVKTFTDSADQFRAQSEEVAESLRAGFETAQERFGAVNAEVMNAAREEMTGAVEFANELARAKTVADAFEIQRDYWTKLFETRVERTRAFTQASTEAARDSFEPFAKSMSSAFGATSFEKFFPFAAK